MKTGSYLNDLHVYDPIARSWTEITAIISGTAPTARWRHGFSAADGKLFVHGGFGLDSSGSLSNAGFTCLNVFMYVRRRDTPCSEMQEPGLLGKRLEANSCIRQCGP